MKTEQERKKVGFFKVDIKDVFVTDDGRKFYNLIEAENWEWYLNNKDRINRHYQFGEVSPILLGLRHIIDPYFCYKFYIENHSKENNQEIVNYLTGIIKEKNIDFEGNINIKNRMNGWHVVILDKHFDRGTEIHFYHMSELVTNITNE